MGKVVDIAVGQDHVLAIKIKVTYTPGASTEWVLM